MKQAICMFCFASWATLMSPVMAQSIPDLPPMSRAVEEVSVARPQDPEKAAATTPGMATELARASMSVFDIQIQDAHLRGVIQRWARDSGWVFEAQHWTLQRDIPLAGLATYESNDFRMAVRWLMRSTLQTDLPAQACFYSNHVVRVISLQESCLRSISQE